jgi:hypothetical protein
LTVVVGSGFRRFALPSDFTFPDDDELTGFEEDEEEDEAADVAGEAEVEEEDSVRPAFV